MANGEKEGGIVGMSSRVGLIFFTSGTKGDFLSNVPRGCDGDANADKIRAPDGLKSLNTSDPIQT